MHILQIAPRICWPLDTGAKLRNYHLARILAQRASISLLAFIDREETVNELQKFYHQVVTVRRDKDYTLSKIIQGAMGNTPLPVLNYTTPSMKDALGRLLDETEYDVVQIESVHLINYLSVIRKSRRRPFVVCDWHNIESELMQQYSDRQQNGFRRKYARRTARLMAAVERRALDEFDAHIVVSEQDAIRLSSIKPNASIHLIENGVDSTFYAPPDVTENPTERKRILFVGSMDYHANIDGVINFARDIWPQVHARKPELVFTIVGKDPEPQVRALETIDGVEVTGTVDDVRPFYREAIVSIVPLKVGGGSRLKILEAMAAGVPVISTKLGSEGLHVHENEDIVIADSQKQFLDSIIRIVENEDERQRLIAAGRALVRQRYDWSQVGGALSDMYANLTDRRDERSALPA